MLVLAMASAFSFVLAFERIPHAIAAMIVSYADHWVVFVLIVNFVFFLLGMIMDALPALIILMPILVPAGVELGMEPIHIGIFVAANVTISLFTPPVGVCLFVACGLSKLPIEAVFKPLLPFLAVLLATLLTISYVPENHAVHSPDAGLPARRLTANESGDSVASRKAKPCRCTPQGTAAEAGNLHRGDRRAVFCRLPCRHWHKLLRRALPCAIRPQKERLRVLGSKSARIFEITARFDGLRQPQGSCRTVPGSTHCQYFAD